MYITISPKDPSDIDLLEKVISGSFATQLNSQEFDQLSKQIKKYDPIETITRLSGLLTVPSLHANNLRLEILVHLALVRCRGDRKPSVKTIENWCNGILGNTAVASYEDPVEDVFITNIETNNGNLRLFQGTRASSDYYVQTMVDVLSDSNAPSTWRRLHETVVALLLVSDRVVEQVGLTRWHTESSVPSENIRIKPTIGIVRRAHAVCFTDEQLSSLGINREVLTPFIFKPENKNQIIDESIGHTTLERYPILNTEKKLILALPHAVSRAIRRFAICELRRLGDLSLFSQLLASYQANQIEQYGLLEFITNEKLQVATKNTSLPIKDWLYKYDTDKCVHVVLIQADMSCPDSENLDSMVSFSVEEVSAIESYLTQTADSCMSRSDTTEGATLVVFGGLGYGMVFAADGFPKGWRYSVVWIHDILMMAYEWEHTVTLFLKFLKHKKLVEEEGVEFAGIVGDYGLFCLWRESGFQLIPQNLYVKPGYQLCVLESPVLITRVKQRRNLDRHFIPTVEGKFVTVTRLSLEPEFKSILSRPIYGSPQHILSGILAGVVESRRGPYWLVGIPWKNYKRSGGLFMQVWNGFLDLYERLVPKIESLCQATRSDPIEICLNFSEVVLPTDLVGSSTQNADCVPSIDIYNDHQTAEIKFPDRFLLTFMQSENHGEQIVVRCIAWAVSRLINTGNNSIDEQELGEVVNNVLVDTGMRVLHVIPNLVPFKAMQMRKSQSMVFLAMEDFVFSKIKLSDGCRANQVDRKIKSRGDCIAFLNKVVDKVWNQLYELLQNLDRLSTVRYVLNVHESVLYSREYWGDMSRAISTFYGDTDDVYSVTQEIKSKHVITGISARVILEMATCVCPLTGGYPLSREKLDDLLAEAALLFEVASHSDAIKHGLVEPPVTVHPNGEYTLSTENLHSITVPFSIAYHRKEFEESVFGYDGLYNNASDTSEPDQDDKLYLSQLSRALKAEFDITLQESTDGFTNLLELAVEKDSTIVEMTLGDLKTRLIDSCGFSAGTTKAFIKTFGYSHRSAWDSPPSGFDMTDIYPWRLGRRLSIVTRPILVLGPNDQDTVLYGVGTLDLGISFFLSMFEQGHWSTEKSNSEEMKKFIGEVNNSIGHDFTRSVANRYRDLGWNVSKELKMTQLGAGAEYGDIDVLAWKDNGEIQIVECKRLRLASTVAEIAEICSRFCGDAEDELSKHLKRVNWIADNPTCLRHTIGFDAKPDSIDHRLVTNVHVPMSFIDSIPIESEKIGPLEDL